ncbi:hypothetical protein, partial [Polaromonas sp.]
RRRLNSDEPSGPAQGVHSSGWSKHVTNIHLRALEITWRVNYWPTYTFEVNMEHEIKKQPLIALLVELREIYRKEGGLVFVNGINSVIFWLSSDDETENERWINACTGYKTMASAKSGFSDVYIERDTFEERLKANVRLDQIRTELWASLGR